MAGRLDVRDLAEGDFLRRLEKLLGPIVIAALKETMQYTYFGTDDLAHIIRTRPDLFERAMSEIFGKAWPALLKATTSDNIDERILKDNIAKVKSHDNVS